MSTINGKFLKHDYPLSNTITKNTVFTIRKKTSDDDDMQLCNFKNYLHKLLVHKKSLQIFSFLFD